MTVPSPFKILVNWFTPEDTGAGGRIKPIERYILEFELGDPVTYQSTNFSISPFGSDGCYAKKQLTCTLTGNSHYDLGIDVGRGDLGSSGMNYQPFCAKSFDLV